ncbi:hypothetical protein ABPG74_019135 [Tetrahymena malaccensis]
MLIQARVIYIYLELESIQALKKIINTLRDLDNLEDFYINSTKQIDTGIFDINLYKNLIQKCKIQNKINTDFDIVAVQKIVFDKQLSSELVYSSLFTFWDLYLS